MPGSLHRGLVKFGLHQANLPVPDELSCFDLFNHVIDVAQYTYLFEFKFGVWCDRFFLVTTKGEADLCFVCLKNPPFH